MASQDGQDRGFREETFPTVPQMVRCGCPNGRMADAYSLKS